MKASSKYGSAYPKTKAKTASTQQAAKRPRHTRAVGDAIVTGTATPTILLPHERDQAVDQSGGGVPSESVEQACRDVKRGLVDTDRGAETNNTYQKQKI